MSTFLKLLPLELAQIKEFKEPPDEVGPEEVVVGEMTEEQKRMYTRRQDLMGSGLEQLSNRVALMAKLVLSTGGSSSSSSEMLESMEDQCCWSHEHTTKLSVIDELLWIMIRDEFALWKPCVCVAVRKGYKVVSIKEEEGCPTNGD